MEFSPDQHSKSLRSRGVRTRLIMSFVLLITFTTALMLAVAYSNMHHLSVENINGRNQLLASVFSAELEKSFQTTVASNKKIAAGLSETQMDKPAVYSYFLTDSIPDLNASLIFVFDSKLNLLYTSYYAQDVADIAAGITSEPIVRDSFIDTKNAATRIFTPSRKHLLPGYILISSPIRYSPSVKNTKNNQGIIVACKKLDSTIMEHVVQKSRVAGDSMSVYLLDRNANIVAHTDKSLIGKSVFDTTLPLSGSDIDWRKLAGNRNTVTRFEFNTGSTPRGANIGVITDVLEQSGLHILLTQPKTLALRPVLNTIYKITIIGILALTIGIALALTRANTIIKPINDLLKTVSEMTHGNYSKRVRVHRRDEIGSLAHAFNHMCGIIEDKIRDLQKSQSQPQEAFHQVQIDAQKREAANRELHKKINELVSLSNISHTINSSLDIHQTLEMIAETVQGLLDFNKCSVKLLDNETQTLKVNICRGLDDSYIQKPPTPIGEGISGLAAKYREPVCISNLSTDDRVSPDHILHSLDIKSVISYPLISKQQVLGVLNIYSKTPRALSTDELRLLGIFADQAASALDHAKLFDSLSQSYLNTIEALSMAIDAKDRYTHGHSKRVCDIAMIIGRNMHLDPPDLELLKHASDLHDIGKIGISELIISKEGKLSVDEYEIIKTHPLVGETIIEPIPFLQDARPIIRHHHERWDGYGYPDGLSGTEIPLLSRIILIADAYDAMTTDRPYRKALSHNAALREIIKHSSSQFDPAIVSVFLSVFESRVPEDFLN